MHGRVVAVSTIGVLALGWADAPLFAQDAGPNPGAPAETAELGFLVGAWDLETSVRLPDGASRRGSATLEARWILDGFGVLVEEHHADSGFRSAEVYHFDTDRGQWAGAAVNTLGNRKILDGRRVDDRLVFLLRGELFAGRPGIQRLTYSEIGAGGFRLRMDYSPDDGITWVEDVYSYVATRRR